MAGAAGKKETASPSLFMEAFARRALYHAHSDLGTRSLGRGKWCTEQKEAWMKQIFEVH